MNLTAATFAGFVAVVLVLYYLLPRRAQNYVLLASSYVFYATWSWRFLLVLWSLTLITFGIARQLKRPSKKAWLWAGIALNVAGLAFFKYAQFFVPEMLALLARLGIHTPADGLQLLLPVGLSFYSLQAISYLVDVYRRQLPAASDVVDFALYMAYFPKLTAGPIERARAFLPRLAQPRTVDNAVLERSVTLIVLGLVRKVVVADPLLAAIPAAVFETPLDFSAPQLAAWLVAYGFGLYNDFAGYTNLMRGISGLFGLELSRNFAWPLFARNFAEIWNRWHITLSHWLRDYVYFPLSRALVRRNPSRFNLVNLVLPPVVTMAVSGLWHGSTWNFLAWGGVMGLLMVLERVPSLWRPVLSPDERPRLRRWGQTLLVLTLSFLSLVLFRMDLPVAAAFYQQLFTWTDLAGPDSRIFLVMLPALWIDWAQYRGRDELIFLTWTPLVRAAFMALAILAIFLSSQASLGEPFIYQGF